MRPCYVCERGVVQAYKLPGSRVLTAPVLAVRLGNLAPSRIDGDLTVALTIRCEDVLRRSWSQRARLTRLDRSIKSEASALRGDQDRERGSLDIAQRSIRRMQQTKRGHDVGVSPSCVRYADSIVSVLASGRAARIA